MLPFLAGLLILTLPALVFGVLIGLFLPGFLNAIIEKEGTIINSRRKKTGLGLRFREDSRGDRWVIYDAAGTSKSVSINQLSVAN